MKLESIEFYEQPNRYVARTKFDGNPLAVLKKLERFEYFLDEFESSKKMELINPGSVFQGFEARKIAIVVKKDGVEKRRITNYYIDDDWFYYTAIQVHHATQNFDGFLPMQVREQLRMSGEEIVTVYSYNGKTKRQSKCSPYDIQQHFVYMKDIPLYKALPQIIATGQIIPRNQ